MSKKWVKTTTTKHEEWIQTDGDEEENEEEYEEEEEPKKEPKKNYGNLILFIVIAIVAGAALIWAWYADQQNASVESLEATVNDVYLQATNNLYVDLSIENHGEEQIELERGNIYIYNSVNVYCATWNMPAPIITIDPEAKVDVNCFFDIYGSQISRDSPVTLVILYNESETSIELPSLNSLPLR